jgi:dephospho-CoA kinase
MLDLLYLIGVPGCGKTTLARELVLGRRRRVRPHPFAHTLYEDGLVQLGRDRAGHGGTDALSMSVQPRVVAALESGLWQRVLGEGDRLANRAFFDAAMVAGYHIDIALIDVPAELAAERRAARGTHQDERWLKSRESKIENLRPLVTTVLDGTLAPAVLAARLREHPVIRRP